MAAAGFLALAHTLKRGEHIRVTLLLEQLSARARSARSSSVALGDRALLAALSRVLQRAARLAVAGTSTTSRTGNDATPLWIPQLDDGARHARAADRVRRRARPRVARRRADDVVAVEAPHSERRSPSRAMDALITTLLDRARCSCCSAAACGSAWRSPASAWIGMELFIVAPGRRRDGGHDLGLGVVVDADRAAALRLDGRDPVPHPAVRGHVQGPRAVARARARAACCTPTSSAARIFAAVSGSSAATCATIGKMTLPELQRARLPRGHHDRLARRRRHAGPPDPAVDHHDRLRRRGRRVDRAAVHRRRHSRAPAGGAVLRLHRRAGRCCNPDADARRRPRRRRFAQKLHASRHLIPVRAADRRSCWARSTPASRRRPRPRRSASSARSSSRRRSGSLTAQTFCDEPDGRDAALLHDRADPRRRGVPDAGDGLHRPAARSSPSGSAALGLSPLRADRRADASFYIVLGCFLDGISMVVLTMGVILPTVAEGRHRPALVRHLHRAAWSRWRRSRRRSASTCSCCRA